MNKTNKTNKECALAVFSFTFPCPSPTPKAPLQSTCWQQRKYCHISGHFRRMAEVAAMEATENGSKAERSSALTRLGGP